ncbi:hypothetical protein ASE04_21175 [Rhizobium sp. Root708]|uniref:hypothetical protein n=1 Tax=Rhizobium sp. Root708 TaxID=1736592 RepID=UPI000701E62C|nr:hypothetical protein [Rhizobium sp. Root708]KRB61382.1 hypothetical protein ASE04_21175 [Rhizobium sp. Root708]
MPVILTGMSITTADDRVTSYAPVVATTSFAADFPVFDVADISVFVNGIERFDFTVSATFSDGISTNATAVFTPGITGAVDVVGSRDPRRSSRFVNGAALPIPAQNLALDTVEAEMQESARDLTRAHKAPYGQAGGVFTADQIQNAQQNAVTASAAAAAAAASAAAAAVFDPTNYYTKAGAAKAALADADVLGLNDGAFKTFTLANLISSIFKVARKIANAAFQDDVTFYSAAGLTKGFKFLASGITAGQTRVVTLPDKDGTLAMLSDITGGGLALIAETTPSGAAIDFTSLPANLKHIVVVFDEVVSGGAGTFLVRLGTSGGFVSTGYTSSASYSASFTGQQDTVGFGLNISTGSNTFKGVVHLYRLNTTDWICSSSLGLGSTAIIHFSDGRLALGAALTQLRITSAAAFAITGTKISIYGE